MGSARRRPRLTLRTHSSMPQSPMTRPVWLQCHTYLPNLEVWKQERYVIFAGQHGLKESPRLWQDERDK
eukprot:12897425-Prorocentrum_lima.AAC.1